MPNSYANSVATQSDDGIRNREKITSSVRTITLHTKSLAIVQLMAKLIRLP